MIRSRTSFARLWQIRRVIKHHGLSDLLSELSLSKPARIVVRMLFGDSPHLDENRGVRIRKALEELGPVFIKLGQALSTRPDLLPADIALELTRLQDRVPPIEGQQAIEIIQAAYGDQFDDIFSSVDEQPMASASVAQVHAATLKNGLALKGKNGDASEQVIVKVLRPNIDEVIESDLRVMYTIAGLLQKHWSRGEQFKPLEVIEEYDNTIHAELDLRQEAANCSQMAANFEHTDIIYVPQVYWDYTHQNVLVMERIYGTSIRDFELLKQQGHDLEQLGNDGVAVFFKQAFEDNFFHADMHPGNIFVSEQGKWIAVDFGIMGTLNNDDKRYLAEMLLGFFNRDYRSIAEAHLRAQWVPPGTRIEEFESAVRMVCEPNFAKPISEISFGKVMLQLFQTVRRFEIPVQPQLVLLYKTLLNIEGLGRQLHPQLNLWDTAKPFLEEWMKKQLSPQTLINDLKRDWPRWRALLPKLPAYLEQLTDAKQSPAEYQQALLIKAQNERLARKRRYSFPGFITAFIAALVTLLMHNDVIARSALTEAAPWIALVGITWAYYRSRC